MFLVFVPVNVATLLARVVEAGEQWSMCPTTRASSVATFTEGAGKLSQKDCAIVLRDIHVFAHTGKKFAHMRKDVLK